MSGWKSLSRLADETGIPEASCRSYALDQFGEFITVKRRGLAYLVSEDSIPILKNIHSLFEQGMSREQVRDALTMEFGRVYKVTTRSGGIMAEIPVQPETDHFFLQLSGDKLAKAEREWDALKSKVAELEEAHNVPGSKHLAMIDEMELVRATLKALKEEENGLNLNLDEQDKPSPHTT